MNPSVSLAALNVDDTNDPDEGRCGGMRLKPGLTHMLYRNHTGYKDADGLL